MLTGCTVFDFDGEWPQVRCILDHPLVQRALDAGMTNWCDVQGDVWKPKNGPWFYALHDDWRSKSVYPQLWTPDWYRCWGACHWLAAWNCAIGEQLFPHMDWHVVLGKEHSTALGTSGPEQLIVDILWGHDHTFDEILKAANGNSSGGDWGTLISEIECQEARPYV